MIMITPKLRLDWATGVAQPGVDVVRAGVATFVGDNGIVQTALADTQRIDYSKGTAGLLVEESRTNLLTRSIPDAGVPTGWSVGFSSGTFTHSLVAAPTPYTGFQQFIKHEQTVSGRSYLFQNLTLAASTTYTLTVIFDKNQLNIVSGDTTVVAVTGFATASGQLTLSASGVPSNGVVRLTFTTGTTTTGQVRIGVGCSNSSVGTAVFGAWQLEQGSFATSYIPTEASTVIRNADVATITGTNFSDWWQATRGGVLVRARPGTVSGTRPWVQFDDGTANEIIALRGNSTNPELYIVDGGTPQAQIDAGTIAANTDYSLTGWWATNDCKARLNSGAVVTDTSATIPTVTQARLGSDGTNYLNGHLSTINYYNKFSSQIYARRKNKVIFNLI